jgi:hypothetical protein
MEPRDARLALHGARSSPILLRESPLLAPRDALPPLFLDELLP